MQKGFNPRVKFSGIDELAASIKKVGLLSALTVRPAEKEGAFYVVAGERRLRALDALGVDQIPVSIRTDLATDDNRAKAAAIAENSKDGRSDLNAIELGRVFVEFERQGWTAAKIAAECNTEIHTVRRCITLMDAPDDVKKKVEAGTVAIAPALELAKLDDATRAAIKSSLTDDTSATEVRRLAKEAAKATAAGAASSTDGKSAKKKKGSARAASLATWRGSKEKQAQLAELCSLMSSSNEEEKKLPDYFEVRGAVAALLWDRGDLGKVVLPDQASTDAKDLKVLKTFDEIVKAEAKKVAPRSGSRRRSRRGVSGSDSW